MGYYVKLHESTVVIPKENLEEAYNCMCRLNTTHHDIKRGGNGRDAKWFSWMDDNYPETCANTEEIFEDLGFEHSVNEDGMTFTDYDNKTGQEELFFRSIAHLIKDETYMLWLGEDGDRWAWLFVDGKMYHATQKKTEEFMPDFYNELKSVE